jgi:tRNA wybutosine-synthesizing protein 2
MPGVAPRSSRGPRRSPAERVRERLRATVGERSALGMPDGYQRLGRVLVLRLPDRYRPLRDVIGRAWQEELGVDTVLNRIGPVEGEFREPRVERWAGTDTETEVVEHGVRWRLDAARLMFAAGNKSERLRVGALVRPGESVIDLFAGIGYFAIPAARSGATTRVVAVEKNPVAFRYLESNVARNGVADRVRCVEGENRSVPLPPGAADRVFLGYLPDSLPWLPRAIDLVRPEGGWVHVHLVVDARDGAREAARQVAVAAGEVGAVVLEPPRARAVKPYGPGRTHVVVDARVRPAG